MLEATFSDNRDFVVFLFNMLWWEPNTWQSLHVNVLPSLPSPRGMRVSQGRAALWKLFRGPFPQGRSERRDNCI